jgi:hypothetical protein
MKHFVAHKTLWKSALLGAAGIVVAIGLGELILRAAYGDKFGKRPVFYAPDNLLGWKPAPNLDHTFYGPDYGIRVRTDKNGYRTGALGDVEFDKQLIVLCGDSYTFGWGVSTEETFASFLDQYVSDHTDDRMRMINLGVGGYGTWQHAYRLTELMTNYPDVKIAALIVIHCQNDAIDNLRSLGYQIGFWKSAEKPGVRSRSHLVNFLRYSIERAGQSSDRIRAEDGAGLDTRDPALQDVLWSYQQASRNTLPSHFVVEGDSLDLSEMSPVDLSESEMVKRKSLTEIQRRLAYTGNKLLHRRGRIAGCPIFHTYVYTTADWYIAEIDRQIAKSATPDVFGMGRVPRSGAFKAPFMNDHSGRHYNIEFNRFWARGMLEILEGAGVFAQ